MSEALRGLLVSLLKTSFILKEIDLTTEKKQVYTLVEDVYSLVSKGFDISQTLLDEFSKDATDAIRKALKQGAKTGTHLRMSNIGTPPRKLWYTLKGYKQAPPAPNQLIQFMYGHIIEAFILMLVKAAGHSVTNQQKHVNLEGVDGHTDADIDEVLMDVKGMSSYGFNKFASGKVLQDDAFGYIPQISGYSQALGRDLAGFLVFDKEKGKLTTFMLDEYDMVDAKAKIEAARESLKSDTPPPRCFKDEPKGESGNRVLARGCEWCGHKQRCWADANDGKGLRAFKFKEGDEEKIQHFTVVKRTPRVEEIINEQEDTNAEEAEV